MEGVRVLDVGGHCFGLVWFDLMLLLLLLAPRWNRYVCCNGMKNEEGIEVEEQIFT